MSNETRLRVIVGQFYRRGSRNQLLSCKLSQIIHELIVGSVIINSYIERNVSLNAKKKRLTNSRFLFFSKEISMKKNSFTLRSSSSYLQHGVGVEFVRVLPETHPPNLSNIFCECDSKDDVVRIREIRGIPFDPSSCRHILESVSFQTITCDCEATPALQLKAFRRKAEKLEVSHYRVNVNRFRARLNVICITEKLLLDLKCDGWPDVSIFHSQFSIPKKNKFSLVVISQILRY